MKWTQHNSFERSLSSFWAEILPQFTFKTERVGGTALRASWFWPTLARFPGKWGIFSGTGDSKLTPDCLGLQWNGHSTTFWTLTFELLGRSIALLHFKTERLAETALRASWFWATSARFPGTCEIIPSPGHSKVIPDGLGFQWNGHSQTLCNVHFRASGPKYSPTSL